MTFNDSTKPASRSGLVLFFIAHYGIFTLVHGIFVLLICAGVFNFLGGSIVGKGLFGDLSLVNWRGILLIWFGGTVVQLIALLLTRPDRLPAASKLFWQPYPRIIKLHITVLGGIWLIEKLGWAPAAAILLALLHLGFDLASILFERRKINATLSQNERMQSATDPTDLRVDEDGFVALNLLPEGARLEPLAVEPGQTVTREPLAGTVPARRKSHTLSSRLNRQSR